MSKEDNWQHGGMNVVVQTTRANFAKTRKVVMKLNMPCPNPILLIL